MTTARATPCPGCGAALPDIVGAVHPYIGASAACWARYGELLSSAYAGDGTAEQRELIADSYAAQHPGSDGRRQRQSVAVHLAALCAALCVALEHGRDAADASALRRRLLALERDWPWLGPPAPDAWGLTVHDVVRAPGGARDALVTRWARAVWEGWREHHAQVRARVVDL